MLCGAVKGRLENRKKKKKNKQNPVVDKCLSQKRPQQTHSIPEPLNDRTQLVEKKSKLNYIHSSIYKNIPSTLYMYYSRIKQGEKKIFKKAKVPTGAFIPMFLSFYIIIITFGQISVGVFTVQVTIILPQSTCNI